MSIQELYPNPPIRRYHRITPFEERQEQREEWREERREERQDLQTTNWLYIALAFVAGYLIGGR